MKTITLPVYRRADRVKRLLETLRANRPDGYTLFVSAEPGYQDVIDAVKAIDFMPVHLSVNQQRLGLNRNIQKVLEEAMDAGSEFNIALEDDIVLAPDALRLAEWFRTYPGSGEYAVCGFFGFGRKSPDPLELESGREFRSWGYCFTRAGWDSCVFPGLHYQPTMHRETPFCDLWDFKMQAYFIQYGVKTLHPALSRSNHEGYEDGTNVLADNLTAFFKKPLMSDGLSGSEFFVTRPTGRVEKDRATGAFRLLRERVSA